MAQSSLSPFVGVNDRPFPYTDQDTLSAELDGGSATNVPFFLSFIHKSIPLRELISGTSVEMSIRNVAHPNHNMPSLTTLGGVMKKLLPVLIAAVLLAGSGYAQTATPKATERQVHQQRRIHQGVKSGELTKREARKLEAQQAKIQADKLEAKSDGVVTGKERAKLQHEQNRASRKIYKQKHDAQSR
jgi:hypothetical protein